MTRIEREATIKFFKDCEGYRKGYKMFKLAVEALEEQQNLIKDNEKLAEMLKSSIAIYTGLESEIEKIKKEIDTTYEWCGRQYSGLRLKGITEYVNKLKENIIKG